MKKSEPIKRIGLIANSGKAASRSVVRNAERWIRAAGRSIYCDEATAVLFKDPVHRFPDAASLAREVDLLLVFGGDGTMLRVVREIQGAKTPVLGINLGRLGFLTLVPSQNLRQALEQIWKNEFVLESRSLIEASRVTGGCEVTLCALNDIVISRGAVSRMIELDVEVDGLELTRYRCDGLIVSSPTGSTAYSLSAGGAIISPSADVFAITPICPHTLSNRSVIIGLSSTVKVRVISEKVETTVTADGQVQEDLATGDVITIRRSRRAIRLLHPGGISFFETVRQKLHWSGSNV